MKGESRRGVVDRLLKPFALVVIAGVSGGIVWSVHTGDIFLMCLTFIGGGSVGLVSGLVAGVTLAETVLTMGGLTGFFGGIVWGFAAYGWVGVVLGGPLGLVAGAMASVPVMFIIILILGVGTGSAPGHENRT